MAQRKKFHFNTGVKIWVNPYIKGGIDSGNGTVVIPFECEDVPEGATFLYASNTPNLHVGSEDMIRRDIHNSGLLSKYAYFNIIN